MNIAISTEIIGMKTPPYLYEIIASLCLFKNLKTDNAKKAIANYFGVSHSILESWMEHLVYIRNLCAHHCRLWNRIMTVKAAIPHAPKYEWINIAPTRNDKIFTTICIIAYLLKRVTRNAPFLEK